MMIPPGITIRRATLEDRDRVVRQQIQSQNEEAGFHASRERGEAIEGVAWDLIHQRGGFVLIAEHSGALVGHVGGATTVDPSPFFNADWQHYALIFDLYVQPAYRRKGIGMALVSQMLSVLEKLGATRFRIVGLAGNPAALALYRRLGFRDYEVTLERNLT